MKDETDADYGELDNEEGLLETYVRVARELWGSSSLQAVNNNRASTNAYWRNRATNRNSSGGSNYQRPASNGVRYNTQGGNFPCLM